MRLKPVPKFIPPVCRQSQSFYFYPKLKFSVVETESKKPFRPKRRKLLVANEERGVSSEYPYSINLSAEKADAEYLLQTISLPVETTLESVLSSCSSLALYFNRTDLLFMWHDAHSVKEFISRANEGAVALLFAASSNLFDVHYRVEDCFIHLDVCVKPRCILSGSSLPTTLLSLSQYEKVHDFITLQLPDHSLTMHNAMDFIFGQHTETQSEFVSLVKLLYDCCQFRHEKNRILWQTANPFSWESFLSTQLRPYQLDAVKWMIYKESQPLQLDRDKLYNMMFIPINLEAAQRTIHFCIPTGTFVDTQPVFTNPSVGGILADEMGLGKTLEVIGLIVSRPWTGWSTDGGSIRTLDGHLLPPCDEMEDAPTPPMVDSDFDGSVLCSCGNVEETRSFDLVKCTHCDGPYQHAACVQYEPEKFLPRVPIKYGYICPPCWSKLRIDSKATLIVAPDHIWQQWKEELQAHVIPGALEVLIYAGMEAAVTPVHLGCRDATTNQKLSTVNPYSPKSRISTTLSSRMRSKQTQEDIETLLPGFVQPGQLACADIVLTSYSVVQRELNWAEVAVERHSGLADRPHLRLIQRYLCRPSPLTCVRWWRVCLDEAQMVERITSRAARMMSHIESVHRWCVTGTPAEKSINDLFGLFSFLRFEPFSIQSYWHSQLYQPFLAATAPSWLANTDARSLSMAPCPVLSRVQSTLLAEMLSLILWRNTKKLLGDQLSLPPITEETHWVSFTSVERYIHDRVLSESATALRSLLNTTSVTPDQTLATLPSSVHCRLVYLVTRLRQACTHASLVVTTGTTGRRSRCRNVTQPTAHRLGHANSLLGSDDSGDEANDEYGGFSEPRRGSRLDGPSPSVARANRHVGTGCSTMTEVIRRVVDDTRRECEGLLRSWVFGKNGAAGCFIIKQQFDLAAECYRDVLRTADNLEKRHGVLADWSQRLHALSNLNWLIQSCGVPLLNDPLPSDHTPSQYSGVCLDPNSEESVSLDPRVDRDLVAKAERLRSLYIQMHSSLLARVHENLEPVVSELDSELVNAKEELAHIRTNFVPYGACWLTWLSDAVQFLIDCGLGLSLIEMLVSSFRGRPGGNRSSFRTVLLEVRSVEAFKTILLAETLGVLEARQRLRTAMEPLMESWYSFKAGRAVDQSVLHAFYACCARSQEDTKEDSQTQSGPQATSNRKQPNKGRELKQLSASFDNKQRTKKKLQCAYCLAMRALSDYQCALNHERPKAGFWTAKEQIEKLDTADQIDWSGSGLLRSNPLIVSISIVCQQILKRRARDASLIDWHRQARRLEQLFRQMGREVLLTSRTLTLTKEWWNFHDDMEQFVIRLQANCPSDLAFIESHEVESQLHTYIVDSQLVWPRLQSRLGHFGFLRNAYLSAVTGAERNTNNSDSKLTTTFRLECPTCLQMHSPKNPTFALLPGCWHTLCLPCHDRIASFGHSAQRRCPLCRTPFQSNETSGFNARRRRPLTLIHYDGSHNTVVPNNLDPPSELEPPVVGDHSSKIQAVIRCLKKIKEFDPDAKAIVFSSWLSVLITTANALEQNGLAYITLFQPRDACCPGRLAGFHCPGSATWILLMPIQLGANGLNLTSANHLLLIDPVLSHGREAQAIARMHRIGQTRASVVHRFLVRDSIEATLHSSHMRAQAESMKADPSLASVASDCMIGAGPRRSSHGSSGLPGPGEDRALLMQMTIGQLSELLQSDVQYSASAEGYGSSAPSDLLGSNSSSPQSM